MATFPVSLDALIEYIRGLHPGGGPLDHLADAVMAANQLDEQSDAIIGYFVDQARVSGASWSQIGAALGVSKQAAQKRFVVRDEESATEGKTFSRFTPRARASMAAAGRLATAGGTDAIDVGHLVAGAILDPDGLAARTLDRLEVSPDRIYAAIGVGPAAEGAGAEAEPAALRQLQFTPEVREALKEALRAALRLEHNYIGTEHLLLGAAAGTGAVARHLAALDLTPPVIESAIAVEMADLQLRLRRRAR
jgi:ATP-dependent Clp protease ATP-binding subunit ClpA